MPPFYDFEKVRVTHREIEAGILEHWELLHPVVQDYLNSWWLMWDNVIKENERINDEINQKISMLTTYRSTTTTKIQDLTNQKVSKESELKVIKDELQQKEAALHELEATDKEKSLGIADLRSELEKSMAELNLKITEKQKQFNTTQSQVVQSFEHKITRFESEIASLKELSATQQQRIQKLQSENQVLKAENQQYKVLEDSMWEIITTLKSISIKESEE